MQKFFPLEFSDTSTIKIRPIFGIYVGILINQTFLLADSKLDWPTH